MVARNNLLRGQVHQLDSNLFALWAAEFFGRVTAEQLRLGSVQLMAITIPASVRTVRIWTVKKLALHHYAFSKCIPYAKPV